MWNLFQKQEQHKLDIKDIIIVKNLFPKRLIYNQKIYNIISCEKKYKISKYLCKVINDKLEELYIIGNTCHPNAKPKNGEFCIPSSIKGANFDSLQKNIIENILTTFNIDYCYFTPWGEITYNEVSNNG